MTHFPPILFGIGFAALVIAVTAFGRKFPVPPPVLQVLAGLLVGLLPAVRFPELDPDVVFFVFLPPILWAAAFFTNLREFKRNLRPISLLAIGLVLTTTVVVALAARALIPGMPWAVAVALGAIVSPPDAVAATAIVSRLPVPRRIVVLLEGESLLNDASALVLYRTAVAAAVTGVFSLGESIVRFFIDAGVGTAIGLIVGWLIIRAARSTRDTMGDTLLTITGPYVAWLLAESIQVSAVLACVAGGLYVRQNFSTVVAPVSRIYSKAIWDMIVFVFNAMIFILLGLQFADLLKSTPPNVIGPMAWHGLIIGVVMITVRLVWVPIATLLPRMLSARTRRTDPRPAWQSIFLVSWTSMRGIVSLATALALPRLLGDGTPFPHRVEIIVITMTVIVMTLVVQGVSLEPIIRRFSFAVEHTQHEEERLAQRETLRRGAEALEDMAREGWASARDVQALRDELRERKQYLLDNGADLDSRRRLRRGMLDAERRMLVRLRNEGAISDEVQREMEQDLDLQAIRAGFGDSA